MKQKIQISIPEPCHQGWQNMTPVEKGRFCSSCQKTVLDFTYLSDNEIINLVNKNDTLCGRINTSQLNRNLIETKRTSTYFGYFVTSVLAFLGLGTESVVAQEKPVLEQTDLIVKDTVVNSNLPHKINGIVKDKDGVVSYVEISLKGTKINTTSDSEGFFQIKVQLGDVLIFNSLGRIDKEITVSTKNEYVVFLEKDEQVEEITVMTGFIKKRTFFGRTFHKIGNWFR
jgi:hypothetical protein